MRAILDYRSRLHKEDDWLLSRTGIAEWRATLISFMITLRKRKTWMLSWRFMAACFLTQSQSAEFKSKSDEEHKVHLKSHATESSPSYGISSFHCVVCCKRNISKLTPEEAYWLGVLTRSLEPTCKVTGK